MLPSRVKADEENASPEDIFSSALSTIFTDDTINAHGTPGSYVTYMSASLGELRLHIPQYPNDERGRQLFAHHLWNGGVVAAEAIERASLDRNENTHVNSSTEEHGNGSSLKWNRHFWDVSGKSILELGAGTALPSIVSALCNAASVTITDHPSSPGLTTGIIEENVKSNLSYPTASSYRHVSPVSIHGYIWGSEALYEPDLSSSTVTFSPTQEFDRIIMTDCLWLPSQHVNLIKTVLQFLPPPLTYQEHIASGQKGDSGNSNAASSQPCALVVAGFHTGRRIVANFISLATDPHEDTRDRPQDPQWQPLVSESNQPQNDRAVDLLKEHAAAGAATTGVPNAGDEPSEAELAHVGKLKLMEIFEVDVNLNTRPWSAEREGETKWDAKRWCVVAVLVRR